MPITLKPRETSDFQVVSHGSICLLTPLTPDAHEWVEHNVPDDALTVGLSIVVEPRYIADIVEGFQAEGLSL